jgi:hypothetical protein
MGMVLRWSLASPDVGEGRESARSAPFGLRPHIPATLSTNRISRLAHGLEALSRGVR